MSRAEADICVIGGGPAGAAFALRMASLRHRVVLIERAAFPRPHLGEVLTPGVWPLLGVLGLAEDAQSLPHIEVAQAHLTSEGEESVAIAAPRAAPVTIDRGRFDLLILAAAQEAGVHVLQPALARRPTATEAGWEVEAMGPEGKVKVATRFLADGTGRARVVRGSRARRSVPTMAMHARWRSAIAASSITRLEAGAKGWFWRTHLPDDTVRAFAFVDPQLIRRSGASGRGIEGLYRQLLESCRLLEDLRTPQLASQVEVCDATSYLDERPITRVLIRLGDASCAIDPLSSSGVQKALQSALAGSAAAHTILDAGGDTDAAIDFYGTAQREVFEANAKWSAAYYASQPYHTTAAFWKKRSLKDAVDASPAPGLRLSEALHNRVRLASGAEVLLVPCVVRDGVARRRALRHPRLRRPVAFLGGLELGPLLDAIVDSRTFGDAVQRWEAAIGTAPSLRVADWFCRNGLLEVVRERE